MQNGLRQRNWTYTNKKGQTILDFNPVVFITATALIAVFVLLSLIFLDDFTRSVDNLQAWIANKSGWFYVLTVNIILAYLIYLLITPTGSIRLGGNDARPEFSLWAWFAMLFSAGMGIGLMFYSVAEPMYHLTSPPHGAEAGTLAAYKDAIKTTFLHWGLHAWGIYALMGLGLAYFAFNRGQPLSIRGLFHPLLGDRINGPVGDVIDVLATVATLFGVATSLGLGVSQINAGLEYLFGIAVNGITQIILITLITAIATVSVILGLDKGIRRLSVINILMGISLLLFVLIIGPTLFIFNGFVESIGLYLDDFFYLSFWNETYTLGHWQNGWTVFYWGWWIAWSPFVGMFIARISKGRTIREFIAGVLLAATAMTLFWLSVFGNSALFIELNGAGGLAEAVQQDLAKSLFVFLEMLPSASGFDEMPHYLFTLVGSLAALMTISFFVTSSDSGSLVIDMITSGGHPNPPVAQRIYWATAEGVVAAVLLVGGGLTALQTAAISVGLPFAVIILLLIVSLHKALMHDYPVN